jgi:hypothetical protein
LPIGRRRRPSPRTDGFCARARRAGWRARPGGAANNLIVYPNLTNVRLEITTTTGGTTDLLITGSVNPSRWYHVVGVYNGSTMVLYLNGSVNTSVAKTGSLLATTSTMLGSNQGAAEFYSGVLDEVESGTRAKRQRRIHALPCRQRRPVRQQLVRV